MGTFSQIEDYLPDQFSLFQIMTVLEVEPTKENIRDLRNKMGQFSRAGLVERIGKNMYRKTKPKKKE